MDVMLQPSSNNPDDAQGSPEATLSKASWKARSGQARPRSLCPTPRFTPTLFWILAAGRGSLSQLLPSPEPVRTHHRPLVPLMGRWEDEKHTSSHHQAPPWCILFMLSQGGGSRPRLNPISLAYSLGTEGAPPAYNDGASVGYVWHARRSAVLQISHYVAAVDSSSNARHVLLHRRQLRAGDEEQSLLPPSRESPQLAVVVASENGGVVRIRMVITTSHVPFSTFLLLVLVHLASRPHDTGQNPDTGQNHGALQETGTLQKSSLHQVPILNPLNWERWDRTVRGLCPDICTPHCVLNTPALPRKIDTSKIFLMIYQELCAKEALIG